jgi:alpha-tubulin suppressor-like RCC1 family protein
VGTTFACFGRNDHGQLGNMTFGDPNATPQRLPGSWLQLATGGSHTCGIASDHTLSCWGDNAFGESGVGSFDEFHQPTPVNTDNDWLGVVAGVDNTCALKMNHDLYCWGRNLEGEVGDGKAWRTTLIVVP